MSMGQQFFGVLGYLLLLNVAKKILTTSDAFLLFDYYALSPN